MSSEEYLPAPFVTEYSTWLTIGDAPLQPKHPDPTRCVSQVYRSDASIGSRCVRTLQKLVGKNLPVGFVRARPTFCKLDFSLTRSLQRQLPGCRPVGTQLLRLRTKFATLECLCADLAALPHSISSRMGFWGSNARWLLESLALRVGTNERYGCGD